MAITAGVLLVLQGAIPVALLTVFLIASLGKGMPGDTGLFVVVMSAWFVLGLLAIAAGVAVLRSRGRVLGIVMGVFGLTNIVLNLLGIGFGRYGIWGIAGITLAVLGIGGAVLCALPATAQAMAAARARQTVGHHPPLGCPGAQPPGPYNQSQPPPFPPQLPQQPPLPR